MSHPKPKHFIRKLVLRHVVLVVLLVGLIAVPCFLQRRNYVARGVIGDWNTSISVERFQVRGHVNRMEDANGRPIRVADIPIHNVFGPHYGPHDKWWSRVPVDPIAHAGCRFYIKDDGLWGAEWTYPGDYETGDYFVRHLNFSVPHYLPFLILLGVLMLIGVPRVRRSVRTLTGRCIRCGHAHVPHSSTVGDVVRLRVCTECGNETGSHNGG